MQKAIRHRRRHLKDGRGILLAVAGRPDKPTLWNNIASDAAVEHELLGHPLHRGRRQVDLVEKQDARALARQKLWRVPAGAPIVGDGEAAQVGWGQLR
jgi:hypothetical protein